MKDYIRYILPSDNHSFIARVMELGVVAYNFDSYEELAKHSDCKYSYDVGNALVVVTRRVESLNMVGDMLWPESIPENFKSFPVSRYEWLNIILDIFLMRYISIVDCALLLVNEIYETNLVPHKCYINNLSKKNIPDNVIEILQELVVDQGQLRTERNSRFHHGEERNFTRDDLVFKTASRLEYLQGKVLGTDRAGREINIENLFKEGLIELQRDFNIATRRLIKQLDRLYDELGYEFEERFIPRIRSSVHGFAVKS